MFKKFLAFAVALALVLPMDVMAKGGSSGGGRSSGGFSSGRSSGSSFSGSRSSGFSSGSSRSSGSGFSSKPSSGFSGSSSKPAAIPSTPRSSGSGFSSSPSKPSAPAASSSTPSSSPRSSGSWFSSSPSKSTPATTSKPPQTSLDSKVAKANTTSAPSYKTKEQAITAFKEKNAAQYSSKFTTEPKTRPEYIPQSTNVGGKTVNISYNSGFGGYGYYHPSLGTWMAYDMMHDAAMMSVMMNRHGGYGYVDGPGYAGGPVVVHQSSAFSVFITFFLVLALIFAVIIVARIVLE